MLTFEALRRHASPDPARPGSGPCRAVVALVLGRAAAGVLLAAGLLLVGCSQVETVQPNEPVTDPAQLYVHLALNYAAVNLATDTTVPAANTLQLVATPYDGAGSPIADAPAATFALLGSDTVSLKVTPDGRLQGRQAASGIRVVATLTIGSVRHTDTAVVNVLAVSPIPVLDTFTIQVPSDNAVWYVGAPSSNFIVATLVSYAGLVPPTMLLPRAVEANGTSFPVSDLSIEYASLDSTVAAVDRRSGEVTPVTAGHVAVVARTWVFGVAKADTMTYTVQPPFYEAIETDGQRFTLHLGISEAVTDPMPVTVVVAGGIVMWFSGSTQPVDEPMDVTFDDPTQVGAPPAAFCDLLVPDIVGVPPGPYCGTGNIPAFTSVDATTGLSPDGTLPWRFRQFPVPGTYPFHSTITGARGQIVVLAPTAPLP